jgi:hypothetical protein
MENFIKLLIVSMVFCSEAGAVPMVNYKGEQFSEINCTAGKSCSKSFSEGGNNVTVVVNCTSCTDKKKPIGVKKKPVSCTPKVNEKVVTKVVEKVVTKRVEVEVPVQIERVVESTKKNNLSLVLMYGAGGVINYLQTGATVHENDYILEKGEGIMIGPMYQRSFGSVTAGGMILSSGHVGGTIGVRW